MSAPNATRKKIYPKQIRGRSHRWRGLCGTFLYGLFFLLPWINLGDRPAVFFDLEHRQFHIFTQSFWPQDFMFLAWFLIIAAFALFFFTTVAGRLWCGFLCPQTLWTFAFVWLEERIEGPAHRRLKMADQPLTKIRLVKKIAKHGAWLLLSLATGCTFVAYFYPIQSLLSDAFSLQISLTALFWVGLFTYLTYMDAGFLREQVCIYMCPYARFQSVMYDEDTMAVSYNAAQGEPRLSKSKSDFETSGQSQCIDCTMCVQVCPTGIDIRDGMQVDCINCGLCEDACDDIMRSIGRPTDLISFNTLNKLNGIKSRLIRPKSVAYFLMLALMVGFFSEQLITRSELQASLVRDRDRLYQQTKSGSILNYYEFKIANKSQQTQGYDIAIKGGDFLVRDARTISLEKGASDETFLTVESLLSREKKHLPNQTIIFEIRSAEDAKLLQEIESRFMFPRR